MTLGREVRGGLLAIESAGSASIALDGVRHTLDDVIPADARSQSRLRTQLTVRVVDQAVIASSA